MKEFEEIVKEKVRRQLELIEKTREVCFSASLKCGGVLASILYGSLARLEFSERGDIDVLFIVKDKKTNECLGKELTGKEPCITPLILTLDEWYELREEFKLEVLNDGILLYASGLSIKDLLQSKPYILIKYSMKNLTPAGKSRVTYLTSGARIKRRNGKYYRSKSLLEKVGGIKLAETLILIPYKDSEEFLSKFHKTRVLIEKRLYILIPQEALKQVSSKESKQASYL